MAELCPDCPSHVNMEKEEVKKTVTLSLEKFNKESTLSKHFSLLNVTRAKAGVSLPHAQRGHMTLFIHIPIQMGYGDGIEQTLKTWIWIVS